MYTISALLTKRWREIIKSRGRLATEVFTKKYGSTCAHVVKNFHCTQYSSEASCFEGILNLQAPTERTCIIRVEVKGTLMSTDFDRFREKIINRKNREFCFPAPEAGSA